LESSDQGSAVVVVVVVVVDDAYCLRSMLDRSGIATNKSLLWLLLDGY
jgi:hypothetical protein